MSLPKILPIRTGQRHHFALRVVSKPVPNAEPVEVYEWVPRTPGTDGAGFVAIVSGIAYLPLQDVRRLVGDQAAQTAALFEAGKLEVFYDGERMEEGGASIPELYAHGLALKIYALSSVGSDPFAEAPAASQL